MPPYPLDQPHPAATLQVADRADRHGFRIAVILMPARRTTHPPSGRQCGRHAQRLDIHYLAVFEDGGFCESGKAFLRVREGVVEPFLRRLFVRRHPSWANGIEFGASRVHFLHLSPDVRLLFGFLRASISSQEHVGGGQGIIYGLGDELDRTLIARRNQQPLEGAGGGRSFLQPFDLCFWAEAVFFAEVIHDVRFRRPPDDQDGGIAERIAGVRLLGDADRMASQKHIDVSLG